jgi:Carboxypeptidase regulatory-like domain
MRSSLLRLIVFAAMSAALALGQVATGNIRGTISDPSGGVLPNCTVTVVHTNTGLTREVNTNESGDFNVPSVPVGEYKVTAGVRGFQTKTLTGLVLQVDQTAIVPITLEPGAVTQTVEVTAAAPVLDSQTSSLGQVIENKRIVDLPLNGRNPFALGVLAGGTVAFQGLNTNCRSSPVADGTTRTTSCSTAPMIICAISPARSDARVLPTCRRWTRWRSLRSRPITSRPNTVIPPGTR